MDNKTIRLINLRKLLKETKTAASLALAANTSPAYLSQILSNRTKGHIGDKLARKLEIAAKKPCGWLDSLHECDVEYPHLISNISKNKPILQLENVLQWLTNASTTIQAEIETQAFFYVEMQGNTMMSQLHIASSICPGDILMIHPQVKPDLGDTVLVKINHSAKIRVLSNDGNELILQPLNPQYPIAPFSEETQILGVVLEIRRKIKHFHNTAPHQPSA